MTLRLAPVQLEITGQTSPAGESNLEGARLIEAKHPVSATSLERNPPSITGGAAVLPSVPPHAPVPHQKGRSRSRSSFTSEKGPRAHLTEYRPQNVPLRG